MAAKTTPGHPGDHVEVFSRSGASARCGEIIEVSGPGPRGLSRSLGGTGASPSTTRRTAPRSCPPGDRPRRP